MFAELDRDPAAMAEALGGLYLETGELNHLKRASEDGRDCGRVAGPRWNGPSEWWLRRR